MRARGGLALVGALMVWLTPRAGLPQPAPSGSATASPSSPSSPSSQESKVVAQALFDEGMALRKKGAGAEACAKIEESFRVDPAPGTKFYLAECLERAGKLASAWLLYTEVADAMAASGQEKRETFARERSAVLAPKLSRLKIAVAPAARVPGLVVRRDGVPLGEAQWGFAVPVDSGSHTIEGSAPNAQPFTRTVEVSEAGLTVTVEVPTLGLLAGAPVDTCAARTSAPPGPTVAPPAPLNGILRNAGLAVGGVGAAGLVVGGVLGGLAVAKGNESNRGPCDLARDVCTREGLGLRADAITMATGSTVAFVVGGVMLAAGVGLVAWPALRPVQAALVVRPGGLTLEGRW